MSGHLFIPLLLSVKAGCTAAVLASHTDWQRMAHTVMLPTEEYWHRRLSTLSEFQTDWFRLVYGQLQCVRRRVCSNLFVSGGSTGSQPSFYAVIFLPVARVPVNSPFYDEHRSAICKLCRNSPSAVGAPSNDTAKRTELSYSDLSAAGTRR